MNTSNETPMIHSAPLETSPAVKPASRATAALREVARIAGDQTDHLPVVSADAVQAAADQVSANRFGSHGLVIRIAAAAAIVVAAFLPFLMSQPRIVATGPIPAHLSSLVDSLYSSSDYVVDEIAGFWAPDGGDDSSYIDSIVRDVARTIGEAE